VLPRYIGFSTWYVQGECSNDIFTFTEVPIITVTFPKGSADSKSEKRRKPLCLLSQAEQKGRRKSLTSKWSPLKLCVI